MFGYLKHPLPGNKLAAEHILEEREYILPLLGPAERDEQNCIVGSLPNGGRRIDHARFTVRRLPSSISEMTPTGFEPVLQA